MAAEILMPKLGMTMDVGKIVEWRKQDKESVNKGDVILEIESDKVSYEVEAEGSGILAILIEDGEEIPVGTVLGYLAASEDEYAELKGGAAKPAAEAPAAAAADAAPVAAAQEQRAKGEKVRASPGARKLAKKSGIDIALVTGTGPQGRITREDVQKFVDEGGAAAAAAAAPPVIEKGKRLMKKEKMSGMRGTISRRMMDSLHQSAQMTAFAQWDVSNLMTLRKAINKDAEAQGYKVSIPGLMVFFLARVLKEMPALNASIEGNEVHYWKDVNVGVAVSVADGLVVPVVHGANRLSLKDIQIRLDDLIERARNKKLLPDDMAGGTFTLSNLGSYGSEFETVIINPPEVALLGIGAAEKRPVVVNDEIVIRPIMPVSLSFDHRLIDGAAAGEFRQRLRKLVENPGMLATCAQFGF